MMIMMMTTMTSYSSEYQLTWGKGQQPYSPDDIIQHVLLSGQNCARPGQITICADGCMSTWFTETAFQDTECEFLSQVPAVRSHV